MLKLSHCLSDNAKARIDAGYFRKKFLLASSAIERLPHDNLGDLVGVFRKGIFEIKADTYVQPGDGVPFVRIGDLRRGLISKATTAWISHDAHALEDKTRLTYGDIILSKTGYPAASFVTLTECNASQDTVAVKLSESGRSKFYSGYIVAFLNSSFGLPLMERQFQGNVQQHLSLDDGKKLAIPKFGRDFQRQIDNLIQAADKRHDKHIHSMSLAEKALEDALGLANWSPPEPLSYSRKLSALGSAGRWDSQFHLPKVDEALSRLAKRFELTRVGSLGEVINGNPVAYSEEGIIPIVRSGDLVDLDDVDKLLRTSDPNYFPLKRGDVLISSIGFGSIGKVQVFDKPGSFGTVSEVTVIRQNKMDPYFLAAYLRSQSGQLQIDRWITGATGQLHLYPRDVKHIQVPMVDAKIQSACRKAAENAREHRKKADLLLESAKRAVEIAIKDGEKAAIRFLKDVGE